MAVKMRLPLLDASTDMPSNPISSPNSCQARLAASCGVVGIPHCSIIKGVDLAAWIASMILSYCDWDITYSQRVPGACCAFFVIGAASLLVVFMVTVMFMARLRSL